MVAGFLEEISHHSPLPGHAQAMRADFAGNLPSLFELRRRSHSSCEEFASKNILNHPLPCQRISVFCQILLVNCAAERSNGDLDEFSAWS